MTLQSSGAISMANIHTEFGLGYNLNAYRGVTWYTDDGTSGTFSTGAISMSDFYAKRATPAASASISNQSAQNFSNAGIGGSATATYRLHSNGQAYRTNTSGTLISISGEWLTAGSASSFNVYATWSGSGGTVSGPVGNWYPLDITQTWTLSATNTYASRTLSVLIMYIPTSSTVDSATITFEVDSAP